MGRKKKTEEVKVHGEKMNLDKEVSHKGDMLILSNEYPIRIGFLPDMHCGSTRAVSLPEFIWYDAGGMAQKEVANEAQLKLYALWKRNIVLFKKYDVQHVFVIGDAFSGANYLERGAYNKVIQAKQVKLAADLLEEVWEGCDRKVDFYVWRGTKYHESPTGSGEMHEGLVGELKSRGIGAKFMYQTSYVELHGGRNVYTGEKRVRRLFVAHEAPVGLVYTATLMSRDIDWFLQAEASGEVLPVDAIIRAHGHKWLHVDHHGIHAIQLPCWQGHVPYKATTKYFSRLQPTLGGALMLMDEYGRLTFWGGSFPFGFSRKERLEFHRLCMTITELEPNKRLFNELAKPVLQPSKPTERSRTKSNEIV